jgi:uncharacterized membrane protein
LEAERLEAFSDGVLAILITIMVLELRPPHRADLVSLYALAPVFASYLLSFIYLGIYWNNHHHLLYVTDRINGRILWSNLHLLFWLSLVPFVTAWMGDYPFAPIPTAAYGAVLLLAAVAYFILQGAILAAQGPDSLLARAIGYDLKGKLSVALYTLAVLLAFSSPVGSCALYALVALIWLIPDLRIERALDDSRKD